MKTFSLFTFFRVKQVWLCWLLKGSLVLILSMFLLGCADETSDDGETIKAENGNSINLKLVDYQSGQVVRAIKSQTKVKVVIKLHTTRADEKANVVVQFATNVGSINPDTATALTSTSGEAVVELDAGELIGAGQISAVTNIEGLGSVAYPFSVVAGQTNAGEGTNNPDNTDNANNTTLPDTITDIPDTAIIGAIHFVETSPDNIVLRGTGGTNRSETSKVTFQLLDALGEPITNRNVSFSLNTDVGGLRLNPSTSTTNSEGKASTIVYSGSIPTVIRVTALADVVALDGTTYTIFTQSDRLVVSTGIPDQNSLSIALSNLNPEAANYLGAKVTVTARLADAYNNYIPDGTTVYFTTEGGAIEPFCFTTLGGCSVEWVSAHPVPSDHRVTILATAIGNETFIDTDGDGSYSDVDGEPFVDSNRNAIYDEPFNDANGNGIFDEPFVDGDSDGKYDPGEVFEDHNSNGVYDGNGNNPAGETLFTDSANANGRYDGGGTLPVGESFTDVNSNTVFDGPGFVDLGETYLDANGNGVFDAGETFFDSNGDSAFTQLGDGKYNGVLCREASNCSSQSTVHVRTSTSLIMSGSSASIHISSPDRTFLYASNQLTPDTTVIDVVTPTSLDLLIQVTDEAGQVMPSGTIINLRYNSRLSDNPFEVFTVKETTSVSGTLFSIVLSANAVNIRDVLIVEVITPNGQETVLQTAIDI